MHTERRLFPRLLVSSFIQLNMTSSSGKAVFVAEALDLSHDGIALNCDSKVISVLTEQSHYPPTCQLSFIMPGSQCIFTSRCRLITNRRLAQDKYRLGFKFIAFSAKNEQKLIDYLTEHNSVAI